MTESELKLKPEARALGERLRDWRDRKEHEEGLWQPLPTKIKGKAVPLEDAILTELKKAMLVQVGDNIRLDAVIEPAEEKYSGARIFQVNDAHGHDFWINLAYQCGACDQFIFGRPRFVYAESIRIEGGHPEYACLKCNELLYHTGHAITARTKAVAARKALKQE